MGLISWMGKQLIDVIEWIDQPRDTLVWRYPREDNEIKNGAKLVVREGQVAVLVHEGQLGDVFKPGLYTLSTQNLPVTTSLKSWRYGFESPFKCEVYFVSTVQAIDMKWGTPKAVTLRDADLGIVRVRAFGTYAVRVNAEQAPTFLRELVGTDSEVKRDEIEQQLRSLLVSAFTNALSQANVPVLDLASHQERLATDCRGRMDGEFAKYGLSLVTFIIENVSLPPDVEKAIDERASMGAVGNLNQYAHFQTAKAMREAAQQPGGGVGTMVGLGVGAAMGQVLGGTVPGGSPSGPSVADRLKQLKELKESGLIDDDTFAKKRDAILGEL